MFFSEKPIISKENDLLGRARVASYLAKEIEYYKNKDSLTIGIVGKWGSGKTSFINMVLENFKGNDKYIVIKFNPWNMSSRKQLISDFFLQLSNNIKKENKNDKIIETIGKSLGTLSKFFKPLALIPPLSLLGTIGDITEKASRFINEYLEAEKEDLETIKRSIDTELEKLDKKIIIVIDDIDRLCDDEIREIFQLVKSIADFKNTIYILSYDKEIVTKALDKTQQDKGEEYLEKIIQVPLVLPNITKLELKNIFLKKIEQLIEDKEKELDYQDLNKLLYIMSQIFNNIREIERYINSISLGIYYAKRELNICDYLSINLIKFFESNLYNYILKSEKIFFEKEIKKDFLDKLEYYYKKPQKIEERFLKLIVTWMFPVINNKNKITFKSLEKNKRLNSPKYFYNYFKLNFSEVEINEDEIRKLRDFSTKKDLEELFNKNDEKKLNLIKKIDIILDEISEERRRIKLLKYIFSIADDINFIDKIEGYDNYVSKNIYESEIITIIVKVFKSLKLKNKYNKIKEILLAKKSSFYLSFLVLKELNIILTENKIKKITNKLVNKIIKRSEKAEKVFKNFYLILEFIYNEVDYSTSMSIFHNYIKNKNLLIPIAKEFIEPDVNIALNKIIKKEKKFYKELFEQFYNYHEFLKLIDENIKNPNQEEKEIINCIKNNIL